MLQTLEIESIFILFGKEKCPGVIDITSSQQYCIFFSFLGIEETVPLILLCLGMDK